jgi:hypothetical protein
MIKVVKYYDPSPAETDGGELAINSNISVVALLVANLFPKKFFGWSGQRLKYIF